MAANKMVILKLYRNLLREGSKFTDYNFREYAIRRIRHSFHQNKQEIDINRIKSFINVAEENLELIKRQTVIGNLYSHRRIVIEDERK